MPVKEMIAEIHAAASSLVTAAAAVENGDLAAAEIGIEDSLFRAESLLSRIRQAQAGGEDRFRTPADKARREE